MNYAFRPHLLSLFVCLVLITTSGLAQNIRKYSTDGSTAPALEPGTATGSYALSGFDNVNLFNGNMNFAMPLLTMGGRGAAGFSLALKIEKKFRVEYFRVPTSYESCGQGCYYPVFGPAGQHYYPNTNWWSPDAGFGPGLLVGRWGGLTRGSCTGQTNGEQIITTLSFVTNDGSEINFRDDLTNGQPVAATCGSGPSSRGTNWHSIDGNSASFISDTTIYNSVLSGEFYPSGYLLTKDGSRSRIENGRVMWTRDRNGNKITFTYDTYGRLETTTDSLNRQITISYGIPSPTIITFKGIGGATRTIEIGYNTLGNVLRSDQTLQSTQQLWPTLTDTSSTLFNPSDVPSYVKLPDGRYYYFKYNSYRELARVELPTGGAYEYDWNGMIFNTFNDPNTTLKEIRRWVTEKRIYANGGTGASYTNRTAFGSSQGSSPTTGFSTTYDANGNVLASALHNFYGGNFIPTKSAEQAPYTEGKEYASAVYNGATVVKATGQTWENRAHLSWWTGSYANEPANDPRVTDVTSTLPENNLVAKVHMDYDDSYPYNNPKDVWEYDYGSGAPGALMRRTHTDYAYVVNGTNYATDTSVHLRSLPSQVTVYDASSNQKALTTLEYDNYTPDANHAALVNRTNISGLEAAFTTSYATRGNVTKVSSWRNTDSAYLNAYSQYDIAGNGVKAIDANGNATTIEFDDRFGYPNGEAQSNSAPPAPGSSWLNGQATFAFPTKVTNALGHIAYTQVDYFLGKPVDTEDPNNLKSSLYYDDALDRPTKGIRGVGTSLANQTLITYDDTNRTITTATDKDTNTDGVLQSKAFYDSLGRTYRTAAYEGATWAIKETQFDALGRAYRSSNPFRGSTPTAALPGNPEWTTSTFDALSRVTQITTPDGAHVDTNYVGNTVTVTDQAGKNRKSESDALGRLKNVWENPTGLNYQTSYSYDTLDNLTTVTQGAQTRSFVYDSLKRLTQATNPESGATVYNYDNNGNLTYKVDALNRSTWYPYDALNRSQGYYTNDSNTPQVVHVFDTGTNGKGKLGYSFTTSYWVGCTSWKYLTYNPLTSYDTLGRPAGQQQYYRDAADTTWGSAYTTSRTYDLASNVKSQTYPSGRVANYSYNTAGQMSSFTGNLGDGVSRNYATNIFYTPAGQMTQETFGTTTNLYHRMHYNNRLQMYDTRLGTGSADDWSNATWNRGAIRLFYDSNFAFGNGGTNNNGNVYRMDHFVPGDDSASTWTMSLDYYQYDGLNRITGVWENKAAQNLGETSTGLTQQYVFDRFGNRTVNNAVSNFGVFNAPFNVDQTTNRLLAPNGTISYDAVGNQTNDSYSGAGARTYDANNKLVSAATSSGTASYAYNANGSRITKTVGGATTWMIYGVGGELVAEYLANGAVSSPQKEYGYRGGQMLVVYDSTETGNKQVQWLVQDHLGSTRMVADLSGSLTGMKRHDYLPFGEEMYAGTGIRTAGQGYPPPDDKIRQKFTGYEKDVETGLDYAQARMFSGAQGRFSSADSLFFQKEMPMDPQRFNLYSYVRNNPLKFVDPKGEAIELMGDPEQRKKTLGALRTAVGEQAGAYLYENAVTGKDGKTRYFVGVYTNGPDGKGTAFANINSVSKDVGRIIDDTRVAKVSLAAQGQEVNGYGNKMTIGRSLADNQTPGWTVPHPTGEVLVFMLDPASKSRNGYYALFPPGVMDDISAHPADPADILIHELGHVYASWFPIMMPDRGNHSSANGDFAVQLENRARRLRDPSAVLRVRHSDSFLEARMTPEQALPKHANQ